VTFRTRCFAARCIATVTTGKLMCLRHWNKVPHEIQRRVYDAYRAMRKEEAGSLRRWHLEATRAQLAVAEAEGLTDIVPSLRESVDRMEKGQL